MKIKISTIIYFIFFSSHVFAQTLEDDRLALVAVYNSTEGATWANSSGWAVPGNAGDNPCGWFGVTCNSGGTRVVGLNLSNNNMLGTLPAEIGNLTALETLNLNQLWSWDENYPRFGIGGNLPSQLGSLVNLIHLDLGTNLFTGTIPASLGSLSQLEYLDLSHTPMDGPFDPFGRLNGSLPAELGNLTNLKTLNINSQRLTGVLPASLDQLTNLETLDLGGNLFSGTIPTTYGNLINLNLLNLNYSWVPGFGLSLYGSLNGPIPDFSALPTDTKIHITNQAFNFDGMENNITRLASYSPQDSIPLVVMSNTFPLPYMISADAGAKRIPFPIIYDNNYIYKFYENNVLIATHQGDNTMFANGGRYYRMEITHKLVPGLTIYTRQVYLETAMPVKLISFNVKNEESINLLQWQTSSEINNAGFEVERSADGKNFKKIGFVKGDGDSGKINDYSFTDESPNILSYYRLKQMDLDGKFEYSRIITVKRKQESLAVYPNPTAQWLSVKNIEMGEVITIRNSMGGIVLDQTVGPDEPINISKLTNGMYTITIGAEVRKFVIRR